MTPEEFEALAVWVRREAQMQVLNVPAMRRTEALGVFEEKRAAAEAAVRALLVEDIEPALTRRLHAQGVDDPVLRARDAGLVEDRDGRESPAGAAPSQVGERRYSTGAEIVEACRAYDAAYAGFARARDRLDDVIARRRPRKERP